MVQVQIQIIHRKMAGNYGKLRFAAFFLLYLGGVSCNWGNWWTYEGISGPDYWGLINPDWTICSKGKLQSPIDIVPSTLQYDRSLDHVRIDKQRVGGRLVNTGQSLVFRVEDGQQAANISGGPLAYRYQFQEMYFHWGQSGRPGSEHTISSQSFPAEVQIYGFNSELFRNMSEAKEHPRGLVAFSIFVQLTESTSRKSDFDVFAKHLDSLVYREDTVRLPSFSIYQILPDTEDYITYEGGSTFPGCWETVTWIIFNKPVYISKQQLEMLHRLRQGERNMDQGPLGGNLRPQQPANNRLIRTNVALQATKAENPDCSNGLDGVEYVPNIPVHPLSSRPYSP